MKERFLEKYTWKSHTLILNIYFTFRNMLLKYKKNCILKSMDQLEQLHFLLDILQQFQHQEYTMHLLLQLLLRLNIQHTPSQQQLVLLQLQPIHQLLHMRLLQHIRQLLHLPINSLQHMLQCQVIQQLQHMHLRPLICQKVLIILQFQMLLTIHQLQLFQLNQVR